MKPSFIALAVASCIGLAGCGSDSSDAPVQVDKPIISADLYLRGLNGGDWGGTAEHAKLNYLGNNEYETVLRVARGSNQFKIADPGCRSNTPILRSPRRSIKLRSTCQNQTQMKRV